ncbi:MAG: diguanylate cyclase [Chloroflexota bacterium]
MLQSGISMLKQNLKVKPRTKQAPKNTANSLRTEDEIDALNVLAWKLRIRQPKRSQALSEKTAGLSKTGIYSEQNYHKGLAASLITRAFLAGEIGNLDTSLANCMEALALLENQPLSKTLVDAWYTLGWTNYYLSNYPAALEFGIKSMNLARELEQQEKEAWALDLVASSYKDPTQAFQMYEQAMHIFEKLHIIEGQSRILNNWACIFLEEGDYTSALDTSKRSLQLVKRGPLKREQINIHGTMGEIYLAMGNHTQAKKKLLEGLELVNKHGPDIGYMYILVDLGEVYLAQNDLERAERQLLEAVTISTKMETRHEQSRCHQLLSELYERQGKFKKALSHYKVSQNLKDSVVGENAAKQIVALKISHQIENSQRDAEIQRLQNAKLQQEIDEHKRTHAILENLATRDPLTNLFNRRHFLTLAEQEWKRATRYNHPISVLMMDVDHFKQINDQFGHAAGDQALITVANLLQAVLRTTEIAGRYGGDEFAVVLPETNGAKALIVGKRIHEKFLKHTVHAETGMGFKMELSIGVADFPNENGRPVSSLNELLNQADQALYVAKRSNNNRTHLYSE